MSLPWASRCVDLHPSFLPTCLIERETTRAQAHAHTHAHAQAQAHTHVRRLFYNLRIQPQSHYRNVMINRLWAHTLIRIPSHNLTTCCLSPCTYLIDPYPWDRRLGNRLGNWGRRGLMTSFQGRDKTLSSHSPPDACPHGYTQLQSEPSPICLSYVLFLKLLTHPLQKHRAGFQVHGTCKK